MRGKLFFEINKGEYRVPENEELYLKNYDYFKGMGMFDEGHCQEKALLTTGYTILKIEDFNQ